jgi:hypothetical protein
MLRSLGIAIALTLASGFLLFAHAGDRALPMRFDLRLQGPAETCGPTCQTWVSASGAITADSGRDFALFAKSHNLSNATIVLDSDGGSVLGAIALGREIRRIALATTVGRIVDLSVAGEGAPRATLSPRGDCESMCAFVMLGGVQRVVPPEARVMVHQIWLGDRREDPTAANYSAEDLVLVQRDIGRLAQYTAEMGASIDLLDLSLRIPPWEPMHVMTRDELRSTKLTTDDILAPPAPTVAAAPSIAEPPLLPHVTSGLRASPISERHWAIVDRAGVAALARHHPLTIEGEDIGSFDLAVACGVGSASYEVSYVERRHGSDHTLLPTDLGEVGMRLGNTVVPLTVASSERHHEPDELVSYAAGKIPVSAIGAFASSGNHSVVIETKSGSVTTVIRLGNTGAQLNLPRLAASCSKGNGDRAELVPVKKTGVLAAAQ